MFTYLCAKLDDYALSQAEEEILLSNCSSFSGIKYTFKAAWKSFLILYSLHGSQNHKPIVCFSLIFAFVCSLIGISVIYDLNPFNDRIRENPGGLALEWPQSIHYTKLYTFITCIFIHGNFVHFIKNSLLLLFCGFYLEVKYGWKYFLIVFFSSAIFGEFGQLFMNTIGSPFPWTATNAVYIGSSTGVMGVMGVFIAETIIGCVLDKKLINYIYFKYISTFLLIVTFIGEVIYSIWDQAGIAVWMHIYGFGFGFIVMSGFISGMILIKHFRSESQYIELNDLNYAEMQNSITVEDIEVCAKYCKEDVKENAKNYSKNNSKESIEEIAIENIIRYPEQISCYKKILFSIHFSLALIYFTFVALSIWRVFAFAK